MILDNKNKREIMIQFLRTKLFNKKFKDKFIYVGEGLELNLYLLENKAKTYLIKTINNQTYHAYKRNNKEFMTAWSYLEEEYKNFKERV